MLTYDKNTITKREYLYQEEYPPHIYYYANNHTLVCYKISTLDYVSSPLILALSDNRIATNDDIINIMDILCNSKELEQLCIIYRELYLFSRTISTSESDDYLRNKMISLQTKAESILSDYLKLGLKPFRIDISFDKKNDYVFFGKIPVYGKLICKENNQNDNTSSN